MVHIIADITAAKQAEERLLRLNRLYSLMLKINEAIVRIRDPLPLYRQVCRLAVEEGTFRMAWVGMVEPETRCVKPVASWGFEEGYLDHIRITVDDVPEGRGPTGTCIRTDNSDICNDVANDPRMEPWREEALKRGYRSAAAFPLIIGHRTVGALNLYAGAPHFFSDDQVQLLESLSADLSFALEAAEQEDQRRQAEAELRRAKDGLEERVAERTVELQQANKLLTGRTHDLEQRHREITLLSQMSEVLQSCHITEEAHKAAAQFLRQLFPADSGALFIFGASRRLLEAVATWGEKPIGDEVIDPNDCWALRLGRTYVAAESKADLRCSHVADASRVSLCVPLVGQGEALGLLHLLTEARTAPQLEVKQQLALSVGDRVGLGLANLRLQETLRNLSVRDPLTGLFNRRYLEESLEREVSRARRQNTPLGIVMLDLDLFKDFNDTFGHDAGDILLRELGALLQQHIRGSDVACRYGGEEFTLILSGASKDAALQRAEELRAAVKNLHLQHRRHPLGSITISAGVALFPEHGDTAAAVMQAADAALYRAKEAGRDRVVAAGENRA